MKFEIVDLQEYSGNKAKIYSIVIVDDNTENESLYDLFIAEFKADYREEIEDIQQILHTYGHYTGLSGGRRIIEHEGASLGDGIVAICNLPQKLFRLYAIMYGENVAIMGGGGAKPGPGALRNYEGPKNANLLIRRIKKTLDLAEQCGEFKATNKGLWSKTNFLYNTDDYE